jgi:hypothetical protein
MRISELCYLSWIGAVVALGAAHLDCTSSGTYSGNSAAGESCSRTDDCESGPRVHREHLLHEERRGRWGTGQL